MVPRSNLIGAALWPKFFPMEDLLVAHQALYRIYRPRSFEEVTGQGRIVETLRQAVRQGRLTHAYLFSGPRGTGKTSVARILAKAVQCEAPTSQGEPCLECSACIAMEKGQHLDVFEIDAASNRGIDEIREIKGRIDQSPVMGRYRIYIIDEVHMLTSEAFNALLKTLEEPPGHVIFVLATTEPQKLPVTVLSRCQRYEFQRLGVALIEERLRQVMDEEGVRAEPEALELIAEYADGALRDALSLLDQAVAVEGKDITYNKVAELVGTVEPVMMEEIMSAVVSETHDMGELMRLLDSIYREGKDYRLVLRGIARQIRDIVMYRQAGKELFPHYRQAWLQKLDKGLPADISFTAWFHAIELLAEADSRLRSGFPAQLSVELALFKIREELAQNPESSAHSTTRFEGGNKPRSLRADSSPNPSPSSGTAADPESGTMSRGRTSVDSSEPSAAIPHDQSLTSFLDIIRQERPSTYALLQQANIQQTEKSLRIVFSFPALRDLMMSSHHKALLEQVLRRVYGPEMQYYLLVSTEHPQATAEPSKSKSQEDGNPLLSDIRSWLGTELPVKTIEESGQGG